MTGLDLLAKTGSRGLFIGGEWRDSSTGSRFEVHDPADESVITDVADGSTDDAMAALDAAAGVQAEWAATPPRDRGEILRRSFEAIMDQADDFAELISLEMGKTLAEAKGEVTYGAEFFRWFAEEAVRIHGRWMQAPAGGSRLLTIRKPVGPCLFLTPWNFPLAMGTRKIGPAVAAGCTMVVKPAELTPLTMLALAAVLDEAGLPAGVLNLVTTHNSKALSATLMADPRLRKVSFTGSTPVGKVLVRQSADELQRLSMELGGNAPFIVFEDADVEAAVDGAMIAKMRNMGEACTAANRFLVHESVAARVRAPARRADGRAAHRSRPGGRHRRRPADQRREPWRRSASWSATRCGDGAEVVCGGYGARTGPATSTRRPCCSAYRPTHASTARRSSGRWRRSRRSPTTTRRSRLANATEYGLASYVYTRDLARTIKVAEALEFGMVGVNTGLVSNPAAPFGGVKASGFGREGGFEGIEEYLDTTYVAIPS